MRKLFLSCAVGSLLLTSAALASPCGEAAKAPAAPAAPQAATQQAQTPQARRSYSYEPSAPAATYAPTMRRGYRAPGMHGAGFKIRGRYVF